MFFDFQVEGAAQRRIHHLPFTLRVQLVFNRNNQLLTNFAVSEQERRLISAIDLVGILIEDFNASDVFMKNGKFIRAYVSDADTNFILLSMIAFQICMIFGSFAARQAIPRSGSSDERQAL
ncbi:hypothetical protein [Pseudomonas sp. SWRI99]|uniref:hypothetical protein n=1 Tax=Pseudomonas sp. SWRI99 TaxID=2745506 RepID=UPI00164900C6|nr:hypothetical protein [Pseudomonas sp. SWRI99]MBC3776735.1 hypothetical protein [Pseudomonas sp. SWRI99]